MKLYVPLVIEKSGKDNVAIKKEIEDAFKNKDFVKKFSTNNYINLTGYEKLVAAKDVLEQYEEKLIKILLTVDSDGSLKNAKLEAIEFKNTVQAEEDTREEIDDENKEKNEMILLQLSRHLEES